MANFDTIKTAIDASINTNGKQEITGGKMNSILHQMVDATGEQLTELESEFINSLSEVDIIVKESTTIVDGVVETLYGVGITAPIPLKAGETIYAYTQTNNNCPIWAVDMTTKVYTPLVDIVVDKEVSLHKYTATEDVYVVLLGYVGKIAAYINTWAVYEKKNVADVYKGLIRKEKEIKIDSYSGVIDDFGNVNANSSYSYTKPYLLKTGQIIKLSAISNAVCPIFETDEKGSYYRPLFEGKSMAVAEITTLEADRDMYIVMCYRNNTENISIIEYVEGAIKEDVDKKINDINEKLGYVKKVKSIPYIMQGTSNIIDYNGEIKYNSSYAYTSPIPLKKGDLLSFECAYNGKSPLFLTNKTGSTYSPLLDRDATTVASLYTYTASDDCYIAISFIKSVGLKMSKTYYDSSFDSEIKEEVSYQLLLNQSNGIIRNGNIDTSTATYRYSMPFLLRKGDSIDVFCISNGVAAIWETDENGTFYNALITAASESELTHHIYTAESDTFISITYRNTEGCRAWVSREYELSNSTGHGVGILDLNPRNEFYNKFNQQTLGYSEGDNNNNADKVLTLLFFSDLHGDVDNAKRIREFYLEYKAYITDVIQGGDVIFDRFTDDFAFWNEYSLGKTLNVIGNHDTWTKEGTTGEQVTSLEVYNKFIAPYIGDWNVVQPDNASANGLNYYYKDYESFAIRLIVLDCMYPTAEQSLWFADVLDEARTKGYAVICSAHYPADNHVDVDCSFCVNKKEYDSSSMGNTGMTKYVSDFIDNGGKFICWLTGHVHRDLFGLCVNDERQIDINIDTAACNNRTSAAKHVRDSKSQDCFNIITFDTQSKMIKMFRVGRNLDRWMRHIDTICYDYENKKVIYN